MREKIVSTITGIAVTLTPLSTVRAESVPEAEGAVITSEVALAAVAPEPAPVATPSPTPSPATTGHLTLQLGAVSATAVYATMLESSHGPMPDADIDDTLAAADTTIHYTPPYALPYTIGYSAPDWHRMWLNTAVLCSAYVTTLGVLTILPADATAWNRADITSVAPFNRWYRNIFKWGPEWDHDNAIFNYVLHPYAGAVYFMAARGCGFNFWQSMLYSAIISTVGWEFGIEAFMERPSYQDLFITPVVGSLVGEGFYRLKRKIVGQDYRLAGSKVLGNIVAFLIDPVNEFVGLLAGNDCREGRCYRVPGVSDDDGNSDDCGRHASVQRPGRRPVISSTYWAQTDAAGFTLRVQW